jgi:hypothetical protein
VSLRGASRLWIKATVLVAFAALFLTFSAGAQYPGQIAKPETNAPDLRAVAIFEWTGDEAHPKNGRLVPICIYDGQDLNDAGVYLSQPEPLALQSDVEYQLQHDGVPSGLFDIDTSAREQGGWVGYGKWLPMPAAKAPTRVAKVDVDQDDAQSDVPVLHRKHHAGDSGADDSAGSASGGSGGSGSGAGSDSSSGGPAPDPDGPTLHKGGDASTTGSGSGSNSGGSSSGDSSAPPSDPDRPVLRRTDDGSATGSDSGSPKLKKKKKDSDEAYVDSVTNSTDPDRPHLFFGKPSGYGAPVLPTLLGLPPNMRQTVAVSDATDRPEHPWNYTWANPDDEDKMKSEMEDQARIALGLDAAPAAPARTASKTASKASTAHKSARPAASVPPAPLLIEQFRVFELAYGSGATMVLSAHTMATGAQEKFVTLIGQPDLYGGVVVLMKNVTDAAHLDLTPRMRLVDAVDAEADNRGELLFELRGATQRQFTLYRVLRGDARQIFLSGPQSFAVAAVN